MLLDGGSFNLNREPKLLLPVDIDLTVLKRLEMETLHVAVVVKVGEY